MHSEVLKCISSSGRIIHFVLTERFFAAIMYTNSPRIVGIIHLSIAMIGIKVSVKALQRAGVRCEPVCPRKRKLTHELCI